ncbi:MAG TPA: alpha/beta fold hydrolase [Longimicrobiaceae bacterium]|nr:alpha/beta fold hydrolase [Longimicrobiaceae bacterium]
MVDPPLPEPAAPPAPARPPRWGELGLRRHAAEAGGYRVHWAEGGAGEEAVVLLHGLSGSARWWARNLPALAARYRVLVPDVVGFGRSRVRGPLPDVPTLAAVLAGWMEAAGVERGHLVGHSMGGHLSIHLAARFPERVARLVLVAAAGLPRALSPRLVMRFVYEVLPPRRWGDPRFLPTIWGDAVAAGPAAVLRALRHVLRDDVRPLLARIAAPTLLVWGERDVLVPPEHGRELRRRISGARLLVLPGAYHNAMVDRAEDFNAAVLAFLAGAEVGE